MSNELDWKKFQFIVTVQTALINNAINLSLEEDAKDRRDIFSATGTLIIMDEAFRAAELIPKDKDAYKAAVEFINYMCRNLREDGQEVPPWFARY